MRRRRRAVSRTHPSLAMGRPALDVHTSPPTDARVHDDDLDVDVDDVDDDDDVFS